ncbi:MAG TPA: hypothetical protein VGP18_07825 [Solirubrobacteraceae bacterium]|nr:hypothetical protein [Solirubrobacteraceae bacterium]
MTCLTLLAVSAGAAARTTQPTATISSATLHSAIADRTADKRALAKDSSRLTTCLRTDFGHCGGQRITVVHSRAKLAAAERYVISLSARVARVRHTHGHSGSGTSGSGSTGGSTGGSGSGSGTSGSTGTGTGTTGSGTTGSGTSTSGSGSSTEGAGSGSTTGSGTKTAPPIETPTSTSSSFQPGLNSGWEPTWDVNGAAQLGAKLVRLDVSLGESTKAMEPIVADYAAKGIQVEFLADFYASMPTPAEADSLATWAKTFGPGGSFWANRTDGQLAVKMIEFGNETSYSYQYSNDTTAGYASRAQTYALRFKEAATAVSAVNPGVGMLAQGDAGNAGSTWISNMFKAVPNLGQYVAGWTIHPYGPGWRSRFEALIAETAAQGAPSNIPIDVTEWGLSTDNGQCVTENYGWNACMTYDEAGEVLTRTVSEMRQMLGSRMGLFMLYQVRDKVAPGASNDREEYFGALQHELAPKGAYTTAAQALMAS